MREWYRISSDEHVARVWICGDIGPMFGGDEAQTARQFVKELYALPATVKEIAIGLASPGGCAYTGIILAHALRNQRQRGRRVYVCVHEVAASAATVLMCGADRVTIARDALVCVHDPLMASGARFAMLRDAMISIYRWVSPMSAPEFACLMSAVTWMTPPEVVAAGLAHAIADGPLQRAPFWSESGVERLLPPDVVARVQVPAHLLKIDDIHNSVYDGGHSK
jgi:ATP-dependent protease ClpP protease subunit